MNSSTESSLRYFAGILIALQLVATITVWALNPASVAAEQLFALFSWQPAAIAGLLAKQPRVAGHSAHGGPVVPGSSANLCVFDPGVRYRVDPGSLASLSRNTPYAGRELLGRVRHTVLRGEPVVVDGIAQR